MSELNSLSELSSRPKFTGRRLVKIDPDATHQTISSRAKNASIRLASFSDYSEDDEDFTRAFEDSDGIFFDGFRIAVVNENRHFQVSQLTESSKTKSTFLYSEPERFIYAFQNITDLSSKRINTISEALVDKRNESKTGHIFTDDNIGSWAMHSINIINSKYTGKGVNIAILDTGFNLNHPDFSGRSVSSKSFISGEEVNDQNGHGSHCIGLAAGNINHVTKVRYGVAKGANIFAGKVLSNEGSGSDSSILAGMEWAITNHCRIISMSLGAEVFPGESYSNIYNDIAKRALAKGTLIIAAAGNESRRDKGMISPVGHPANCPAIMAVAALDRKLNVAYFSCGGLNPDGGQVDIAAPGVDVYSSWKEPSEYNTISGTSMATPITAGVAALFCEAYPGSSASDIWMYITQNAMRLDINSSDIGAGFIQPPK